MLIYFKVFKSNLHFKAAETEMQNSAPISLSVFTLSLSYSHLVCTRSLTIEVLGGCSPHMHTHTHTHINTFQAHTHIDSNMAVINFSKKHRLPARLSLFLLLLLLLNTSWSQQEI